jgi:hypothetical protein
MDAFDKLFIGAWFVLFLFTLALWAGAAYVIYAVLTHYHIV